MHLEVLNEKGKSIFTRLPGFDDFYLAGGTALALQIGHRVSVDFDLFSEKKIDKNLLVKVEKAFVDAIVAPSVNNPDELSIFIDNTKVTFLHYPFPAILNLVRYEGVALLSAKEIAVTKAYTIGRRGSYKDYVDLYFSLYERHIVLHELLDIAEKKYGGEFNARLFLEQLIYLEDIEDTSILFLKERVGKKKMRTFFEAEIGKVTI